MSYQIAAFDFDGTLIKGDSIKIFCRSKAKNLFFYYFEYYIISRVLAFQNKDKLKFSIVQYFSKKKNQTDYSKQLENDLFNDSKAIIQNYLDQGLKVVVVSASFKELIGEFVKNELKCDLISNELTKGEVDVNDVEKVRQIYTNYPKSIIKYAYGNSNGDIPMLRIAQKSFWRNRKGVLEEWRN